LIRRAGLSGKDRRERGECTTENERLKELHSICLPRRTIIPETAAKEQRRKQYNRGMCGEWPVDWDRGAAGARMRWIRYDRDSR
jgi:hypothetical protein